MGQGTTGAHAEFEFNTLACMCLSAPGRQLPAFAYTTHARPSRPRRQVYADSSFLDATACVGGESKPGCAQKCAESGYARRCPPPRRAGQRPHIRTHIRTHIRMRATIPRRCLQGQLLCAGVRLACGAAALEASEKEEWCARGRVGLPCSRAVEPGSASCDGQPCAHLCRVRTCAVSPAVSTPMPYPIHGRSYMV